MTININFKLLEHLMPQKDILSLSKDPEDAAKTYRILIYEMANGRKVQLLNTYSKNQMELFLKTVFKELKFHLN